MTRDRYLTPSEQKIFGIIQETDIASHDDLRRAFPDIHRLAINKIISSMLEKGYLYPLKKGKYLVQKEPSANPLIQDPYRVALSLYSGYIGFSSALRLYDLTDYEPFTIFVVTTSVSFGNKATGITFRKGVYVSTIPKTFFDCFFKPSHAGGYGEITKAFHSVKNIDWDEFLGYYKKFGSSSLCQRTGYVLELMKDAGYQTPGYVLKYLRSRTGKKTRLLPSVPSKGKYNSDWKLTDNAGKENILGWLHG